MTDLLGGQTDPGQTGLEQWWEGQASHEIKQIADKARRYGSNSLTQLGRHVARLQGREVDDQIALELGCWINAVQKVERWTDAILRGEKCADDSIYDLHVYAMMTLRIRDTGSWP
jgi:hypothetical protein